MPCPIAGMPPKDGPETAGAADPDQPFFEQPDLAAPPKGEDAYPPGFFDDVGFDDFEDPHLAELVGALPKRQKLD